MFYPIIYKNMLLPLYLKVLIFLFLENIIFYKIINWQKHKSLLQIYKIKLCKYYNNGHKKTTNLEKKRQGNRSLSSTESLMWQVMAKGDVFCKHYNNGLKGSEDHWLWRTNRPKQANTVLSQEN